MNKLSIVTINRNNAEGLKKTIHSVKSQSYQNFEWIVIDGASTDGSKEIIENNAVSMAYWVSELDGGIYNAMNKGVKAANGDYLLFLNSGDWLYSDNTLENVFQSDHIEDIVYGDVVRFYGGREAEKVKSVDEVSFLWLSNYSICHNACFIKRDVMLQFLYDESLKIASDWKFFMQALMAGKSFKHINEYVSCVDMQGVSNTNRKLHADERKLVMDEICPSYLKRELNRFGAVSEVESFLANTALDRFVEIRRKNPLLGKGITFLVLLMKRLCR